MNDGVGACSNLGTEQPQRADENVERRTREPVRNSREGDEVPGGAEGGSAELRQVRPQERRAAGPPPRSPRTFHEDELLRWHDRGNGVCRDDLAPAVPGADH